MSKVTMVGTLTCLDGKPEEMEEVLAKMVEAARGEPGVEIYSYHRGGENTFWFFALMADEESMQHHGQSEAMQAATSEFMPLVAGPPHMTARASRPASRRPGEREDPRRSHARLRFQPDAAQAAPLAGASEDDAHRHARPTTGLPIGAGR